MKNLYIIFLISCLGCSNIQPKPQIVSVPNFNLFIDTSESISKQYYALKGKDDYLNRTEVYGFLALDGVHVKYSGELDIDGEPLPDFETLGHEVWHLVKKNWHK